MKWPHLGHRLGGTSGFSGSSSERSGAFAGGDLRDRPPAHARSPGDLPIAEFFLGSQLPNAIDPIGGKHGGVPICRVGQAERSPTAKVFHIRLVGLRFACPTLRKMRKKRACRRNGCRVPPAGSFGYLKRLQALRIPIAHVTHAKISEGLAQFQEKKLKFFSDST